MDCFTQQRTIYCKLWTLGDDEAHCRFIDCNVCTPLTEDVNRRGDCVCVETDGIWEISVLSAQFCCEPKTALKLKPIYSALTTFNHTEVELDWIFLNSEGVQVPKQ